MESSSALSSIPRVVLLGLTGSGKSELGTAVVGKEGVFKSSSKGKSCTSQVQQADNVFWFGQTTEGRLFLVDTCGLSDSEGSVKDEYQFEDLIKNLKLLGYVNAFLLVLNGQADRIDAQVKAMFTKFKEAFGSQVFGHMMIVYSRWTYEKKEIAKRKKRFMTDQEGKSIKDESLEAQKKREIAELLSKEFQFGGTIPCVFVDSLNFRDTDPDTVDEDDKKVQVQQFTLLKSFCQSKSQFSCLHLDRYLLEKKKLDATKAEHKEFLDSILKQQSILLDLAQKHEDLETKLKEVQYKELTKKIELSKSLEKNLASYFDEREDKLKRPTLVNDIWEICNSYSSKNTEWKLSKSNFIKDLEGDLNKNLPLKIQTHLIKFLETEAEKFAKSCNDDLKSLLSGFSLPLDIGLEIGGVASIATAAFGAVGIMALAEVGLFALLGIVGMVVLAAGGIVMLATSFTWSREEVIAKFTVDMTDKIATTEMRAKLKEISQKALDYIFLKIIYQRNEQIIKNYPQ